MPSRPSRTGGHIPSKLLPAAAWAGRGACAALYSSFAPGMGKPRNAEHEYGRARARLRAWSSGARRPRHARAVRPARASRSTRSASQAFPRPCAQTTRKGSASAETTIGRRPSASAGSTNAQRPAAKVRESGRQAREPGRGAGCRHGRGRGRDYTGNAAAAYAMVRGTNTVCRSGWIGMEEKLMAEHPRHALPLPPGAHACEMAQAKPTTPRQEGCTIRRVQPLRGTA